MLCLRLAGIGRPSEGKGWGAVRRPPVKAGDHGGLEQSLGWQRFWAARLWARSLLEAVRAFLPRFLTDGWAALDGAVGVTRDGLLFFF